MSNIKTIFMYAFSAGTFFLAAYTLGTGNDIHAQDDVLNCVANENCHCFVDYTESFKRANGSCNLNSLDISNTVIPNSVGPVSSINDVDHLSALLSEISTNPGAFSTTDIPLCHTVTVTASGQTYRLFCDFDGLIDLNWADIFNEQPNLLSTRYMSCGTRLGLAIGNAMFNEGYDFIAVDDLEYIDAFFHTPNFEGLEYCPLIETPEELQELLSDANAAADAGAQPGCLAEDDPDQRRACFNCLGQGGIWTAIGCLDTTPIGILTALIRIAFGVMGGVALVQLIMVGLMYQSGQESKIMEAREKFKATIAGIALLVFSVLILRIIGINVLDVIPVGSV